MKQPSQFIVLLALFSTALRGCVAVRFATLEDLLRYHEKQQNPQKDEDNTEVVEDGFTMVTTPSTTQEPSTTHQRNNNRQVHYDPVEGSGLDFDDTTTAATMTMSTTTLGFHTEEPTTTRRMTTCCHLGEQAGRKRHHCNPENYLPSTFRNRNRGHNFKVTNKHPSQRRNQLDKCVSGVIRRLAQEFRICCEEAYKRMWQSERGDVDVDTHMLEIPFDRN